MPKSRFSRRSLLGAASALPLASAPGQTAPAAPGFVDILRPPDSVTAQLEKQFVPLTKTGARWTGQGVSVEAEPRSGELPIRLEAPQAPLLRVHLRWRARVPVTWRVLNEQWERSYGDLEWRGMLGERILPWYFLAFDGRATHGYGVATGANSFAFWQADPDGISLWLDVRNGGGAVRLGERILEAAVVRTKRGAPGQSAFEAARQFCRVLCPKPRLAGGPIYGANNWYYAYGQNCSAADILRDSDILKELSPAGGHRPFMVIDDGWQLTNTAGPWERGNAGFPDMAKLAAEMKNRGVRPGIWTRPLYTTAAIPDSARLRGPGKGRGATIDPTVPEMAELIRQDTRRVAGWGYELIKHDYSSYDLMGRWGFAMGSEITNAGWHFADRTRTNAEVTLALYRNLREASGSALLIGCNTFGHLGAGIFELQRIGDDTSGRDFHRTRRMGVNTLAFRAPQQDTFFGADADCVPITPDVPWDLTARWLDLVARSGTPLFVSADPRSLTAEVKKAVRAALASAARPQPVAEPLDWMETTTPGKWRIQGKVVEYDWYGPEGGTPFPR
jgi:alpha-galactosidase